MKMNIAAGIAGLFLVAVLLFVSRGKFTTEQKHESVQEQMQTVIENAQFIEVRPNVCAVISSAEDIEDDARFSKFSPSTLVGFEVDCNKVPVGELITPPGKR